MASTLIELEQERNGLGVFGGQVTTRPVTRCIRVMIYINSHTWDKSSSGLPLARDILSYCHSRVVDEQWVVEHSRSCHEYYLLSHPDEQANPWIKYVYYNLKNRVRVLISRHGVCLSTWYFMSMQRIHSQLSLHTNEIENRNAALDNHRPVDGKIGRRSRYIFIIIV